MENEGGAHPVSTSEILSQRDFFSRVRPEVSSGLVGFVAKIHRGDSAGESVKAGVLQTSFIHQSGQLRTAGKLRHRLRKIFVRGLTIPHQQLTEFRQDIAKVPLIGAAE